MYICPGAVCSYVLALCLCHGEVILHMRTPSQTVTDRSAVRDWPDFLVLVVLCSFFLSSARLRNISSSSNFLWKNLFHSCCCVTGPWPC